MNPTDTRRAACNKSPRWCASYCNNVCVETIESFIDWLCISWKVFGGQWQFRTVSPHFDLLLAVMNYALLPIVNVTFYVDFLVFLPHYFNFSRISCHFIHSNLNYCIVYIICQFLSSFFVVRVTLVFIGRYDSVIHKITNFSIFGWEKKSKCNGRNIELYGTPSKVSVYKMLTLLS